MSEIMKTPKFKIAVASVGVFLIALISFAAGIKVGFRKAHFSYKFGENYERNFMGPRSDFNDPRGPLGPMGMFKERMDALAGREFRNAHGLAGTILSITENTLIIKDKDNKENTIVVNEKTLLKSGRDDIKISDLQKDQEIIAIGNPGENGAINANLIRVFNDPKNQ
jgi:hypothetical protein